MISFDLQIHCIFLGFALNLSVFVRVLRLQMNLLHDIELFSLNNEAFDTKYNILSKHRKGFEIFAYIKVYRILYKIFITMHYLYNSQKMRMDLTSSVFTFDLLRCNLKLI